MLDNWRKTLRAVSRVLRLERSRLRGFKAGGEGREIHVAAKPSLDGKPSVSHSNASTRLNIVFQSCFTATGDSRLELPFKKRPPNESTTLPVEISGNSLEIMKSSISLAFQFDRRLNQPTPQSPSGRKPQQFRKIIQIHHHKYDDALFIIRA